MKARLIGVLFLLAFALYGSGVDVLMLLNSVDVIAIGVLAFPVLRRTHKLGAYAYLASRILEGVLLAVGVLAANDSEVVYWVAMIGLALGSLFFCRVLLTARLIPRPLAVLGLIGYTALAGGGILELLGYGVGLVFSIPGGLFELILGVLLIVRGFASGEGGRAVAGAGEVDGRAAVR
ncbi:MULTISPECIES: DUF4386 family protein [unclassified Kribbella]|uniref:DUF4386 family protein n=1 Tax=unclassified Kribbella TaxID=2644121 RepID=UPI003076E42F